MGKAESCSWFNMLNPAQITFRAAKFCFPTFGLLTDYGNEHICSSVDLNANCQLSPDVGLYETCLVHVSEANNKRIHKQNNVIMMLVFLLLPWLRAALKVTSASFHVNSAMISCCHKVVLSFIEPLQLLKCWFLTSVFAWLIKNSNADIWQTTLTLQKNLLDCCQMVLATLTPPLLTKSAMNRNECHAYISACQFYTCFSHTLNHRCNYLCYSGQSAMINQFQRPCV